MSPNSISERQIVWQELENVLHSWEDLYSKEQSFLVEVGRLCMVFVSGFHLADHSVVLGLHGLQHSHPVPGLGSRVLGPGFRDGELSALVSDFSKLYDWRVQIL